MRSYKTKEFHFDSHTTLKEWPWTYELYQFSMNFSFDEILSITIDPSTRMADVNRDNNVYPNKYDIIFKGN